MICKLMALRSQLSLYNMALLHVINIHRHTGTAVCVYVQRALVYTKVPFMVRMHK